MNTPHYSKYDEFPAGFSRQFNKAYEEFWKRRNMPVPDCSWKAYREKSCNERQQRKKRNGNFER